MKKLFLFVLLTGWGTVQSQTDVWSYIDLINSEIAATPLIFEGYVVGVEAFPGDDEGNKMLPSQAYWEDEVGYPTDDDGNEPMGYTLAKIQVCKIYKGEVDPEEFMYVLTRSFAIDNMVYYIDGSDTLLSYVYNPPTHAEDFTMFMPHPSWPKKKLFICDKYELIDGENYAGKQYYSNFHSRYEVDFNVPVDVLQPDGTYIRTTAYAGIVPYVFSSSDSLDLFLSMLDGVNAGAYDYCIVPTKPTKPTGVEKQDSEFTTVVYPNPSASDFTIKVSQPATYELKDITGRSLQGGSIANEGVLGSNIAPGIYILEINCAGRTQVTRIVKQ